MIYQSWKQFLPESLELMPVELAGRGKRISDPILALTQTAQAVSQRGDYSVRAPKLTEDELGMLTDAFNRMLSETQENQRHLAEQARLLDLSTDAIIVRDMQDRIVIHAAPSERADSMSFLYTLLTRQGSRLRRPFLWIGQVLRIGDVCIGTMPAAVMRSAKGP